MLKIYGLDIEEFSLVAMPRPRYGETPEQIQKNREKALEFGRSVLGRELLHRLKYVELEEYSTIELVAAEEFSAKRKLNPEALSMFAKRFSYYSDRMSEEVLDVIRGKNWRIADYFAAWVDEFMYQGIAVLKGELEASELFGDNNKLLTTWEAYVSFLK